MGSGSFRLMHNEGCGDMGCDVVWCSVYSTRYATRYTNTTRYITRYTNTLRYTSRYTTRYMFAPPGFFARNTTRYMTGGAAVGWW